MTSSVRSRRVRWKLASGRKARKRSTRWGAFVAKRRTALGKSRTERRRVVRPISFELLQRLRPGSGAVSRGRSDRPPRRVSLYAYVKNDPVNWADPLGLILMTCDRPTHGPLPGNHSYAWDPDTGRNSGRGGPFSGGGPANTGEAGPARDRCEFVPGSEGLADEVREWMGDRANDGPCGPFTNDCHTSIDRALKQHGIPTMPSPNGKFGDDRCTVTGDPG